ncbi:RHS repeat-associated core domain-containing protein [Actinacidiphila alni]|uniref:RHS repeat domain-containing protein n=1 Tax=Actinacidiphila alni TaxID=380248 RepID=UPI0033D8CA49
MSVAEAAPQSGPVQQPAALRAAQNVKPSRSSAPSPVRWPAAASADVSLAQGSSTAPSALSPAQIRALTPGPLKAPQVAARVPVKASDVPVYIGPAGTLAAKLLPATAAARAARKANSSAAVPQAVHTAVASHAAAQRAGVNGLLVSLSRTDASSATERVSVGLDYSGIKDAFGAGYGDRLRLSTYPACLLTTPQVAACRVGTPVAASANDTAHNRLVADVTLPATTEPTALPDAADSVTTAQDRSMASGVVLLGAATDTSGSSGSFKASPLSSSSKWGSSGATGAFTYTYPIAVPPTLGGTAPSLALTYNSQDADGRTSQTNNQGSWVGDSWTLWPGSVNRSYRTCADDGEAATDQEQCWAGDNATLTLNGASHELVHDGSTWRLADDDGSVITEVPGASNGLNGGVYWQLTDRSGTTYLFGADHLPKDGFEGTGTDASTNSAWGAPVYGNNDSEPCHGSTLDASWCTQGWQWNLDFSIDAHKNITVYHYAAETNYYARGSTHTPTAYTRGGALTSITYGQNIADYKAGHNPAAKVTFTRAANGRCDATGFTCTGATLSTANASHWPDVPYDQNCGSSSCSNYGPSFWTNDRLTGIATQVWDTSLTTPGYRTVDTYALANQDFPDPADGSTGTTPHAPTPKAMWLDSITHTGADTGGGGTAVTEKPITFNGAFYPNRVDGLIEPAVVPLNRKRMTSITTETGATIAVSYQNDTCSRTNPPSEDNDRTTCYPVRWEPNGYSAPILDWFNKYLVGEVDVSDNATTKSPPQVTRYDYSQGTPAWHHDDDEIAAAKYRTWDQWRGYSQVTTRTGASPAPISESTSWYLQGMDGDLNANGSHKSVSVTPARGGTITDRDAWSDQAYQTVTYDHDGGDARKRTVTIPWMSPATATHARADGLPDQNAYFTDTAATYGQTLVSGSNWLTSGSFSTYDNATGLVKADDDRGQIDASDQPVSGGTTPERCTKTTWATTTAGAPTGLPSEVIDITGGCNQSEDAGHTLSDVKTFYDHSTALGEVPGAGDPTSVTALKDFNGAGGAARWTAPTDTVYDTYGRITSATDAMNRTTSTAYSPAGSIALPTSITVTNPKKWTTTTTLDVARGIVLSSSDANKNVTSYAYDGLARLIKGWSPVHSKAANANTPVVKFTYTTSQTGPSWVEEQDLRDDGVTYKPEYKIYDSLLQLREVQTTTADDTAGARLISTNFYDSLGRTVAADAEFFNDKADPTSTFVLPVDAEVPNETVTTYDGMGRVLTATQEYNSAPQTTTTTTYPTGTETDVTPPTGATPTATITDARGQTTELRQFHGQTPAGTYDATHYAYDATGRQTALTDSSGNTWTTTFDQLGDKTKTSDPDTGVTLNQYDDDKEVTETTDARHTPSGGVTTSYDSLGRATDTYAVPAAGGTAVHLTHTAYDPTGALGQVSASTSYDSSGRSWTNTVTGYTADYLPTGSTTTIPVGAFGNTAAISYTTGTTYNPLTRNVDTTTLPAAGPMAAESVSYGYDDNGLTVASGGKDKYLAWMEYTHLGQPLRAHMGVTPTQVDETYNWEASTGRLLNTALDMQTGDTPVDTTAYTYNPAGQITSISDVQDGGGTAKTDTQCFTYDYLQRLTQAWTDTGGTTTAPLPSIMGEGGCTHTTPSTANLGGPDPYWQSFGYDATGNRTKETDHSTTGDAGQDATTTQTYPTPGAAHPHAVTKTTVTGNGGGQQDFAYDPVGNTTEIKLATANKTLASGATLASGTSMVTNTIRLTMQTDGNLVMYARRSGQALWSSNTAGHPGAVLTMGTDGNLTVHTTSGTTLWSSATTGTGDHARLDDDGQLIVFNAAGTSVWKTPTWTADRAADDLKFTYDDNGRLATTTQSTTTTTYHYDAAGNLLTRTDNGTTTVFLGADQLTLNSAGTATADTRYYTVTGAPTAVRTATTGTTGTTTTKLHFQAADPHGTATTDITADNTSVTRRAYTPFGQDRTTGGNPTTWPGDQGYVGGTPDPITGLTNLGAREYDPTLGRFLSVDPILDTTDIQSLNGYAYADNTPVDSADPTGLMLAPVDGGSAYCNASCQQGGGSTVGHNTVPTTGTTDSGGTGKGKGHRGHGLPSWLTSSASKTGHAIGNSADAVRNYVDAVATTPDVWIGGAKTVGSLLLIYAGETGVETGGLACATVVGCFAGAPLIAASTAAVGYGGVQAADGAKTLGDGLNQAFNEANAPKLSDPLPQGLPKRFIKEYEEIRMGNGTPQTDPETGEQKIFQGNKSHEKFWAGSREWRVPGQKDGDSWRILEKDLPDGRKVMGWSQDHYVTIHKFTAPHFPDAGWK